MQQFDVLIIGSGLAGLTAALSLDPHWRIAVVTKQALQSGASAYAQGGIAAVLDADDSVQAHVDDTVTAGAGLCDLQTVEFVVEQGPEALAWLQAQQVPFTRQSDNPEALHLTQEGGHGARRIAHVADATGNAIQSELVRRVQQAGNVHIFEHYMAVDLIRGEGRCLGAYVLDRRTDEVITMAAAHVLLATGGASKVYQHNTFSEGGNGDGIAMAHRAGCRIANMEFMQFHPTCLYNPGKPAFLISEAVRGEGGILRLPDGTRFMPEHDERAELAPRDIVARAIDAEMKRHGLAHVYLDVTHLDADFLQNHFPKIYAHCREQGIDMAHQPIPVVPAAHYTCGGVVVDLAGATDLPGLYCLGEAAWTGLHGANRLASNSLLECVVFALEAAKRINREVRQRPMLDLPAWDASQVVDADEVVVLSHNWLELRRAMWSYVGIVRTDKRLARAANRIALLQQEIEEYYSTFKVNTELLEMRNLLQCADLIVRCAQLRRESRGLHYSADTPRTHSRALPTILPGRRAV